MRLRTRSECFPDSLSRGVKTPLRIADAVFGASPKVGEWEMTHGSGGGTESIYNWADDADALWHKAWLKREVETD